MEGKDCHRMHLVYAGMCIPIAIINTQVDEVAKQKVDKGDSVGPRLLGAEAALRVVAEQLPKMVPNMLINKRDGEGHLLFYVATSS